MPSDLFNTSYLGSFAGLVAVTYLLVQFFKEPMQKYLGDWWIRMLAVVIAFVIQGFTLYVAGNFTVETIGLAVLNSFLIAITAAGAHNISQTSANPSAIPQSVGDTGVQLGRTLINTLDQIADNTNTTINTNTPAASKTLPTDATDIISATPVV